LHSILPSHIVPSYEARAKTG